MLFGSKNEEKEQITLDKVIQDIEQKRQKKDVQKWEYLFVTFFLFDAPYYLDINKIKVPYQKIEDMPKPCDIANQMGELGWELVITNGIIDFVFKRLK
jgi:hypothetical protein